MSFDEGRSAKGDIPIQPMIGVALALTVRLNDVKSRSEMRDNHAFLLGILGST
jgi:hypothetical protein